MWRDVLRRRPPVRNYLLNGAPEKGGGGGAGKVNSIDHP